VNLSSFGFATFAAGLAALAGALFLLQRLRVRHREVRVPTLLFWKEAVEESRARVYVRRFRHPWAYALALAAAALLWLAAALPRAAGDPEVEHLLVLDGSAAMLRGERFAEASAAVRARAAALPRDRTRVVFAGARPLTLLAPGEELALLRRRLACVTPERAPSTLADAIGAAAAVVPPGHRLDVEIHGDGALAPEWAAALPAGCTVRRVAPPPVEEPSAAGIVALGVSEAASGRGDAVDLYLRVAGAPQLPVMELDGAPLVLAEPIGAEGTEQVLRDVPARGQRWSARVGGGTHADGSAARVLPARAPLRVMLSPSVPANVQQALAADSGVAVVSEDAEVALRAAGEEFGVGLPALELVAPAAEQAAFLVRGPAASGAEDEVLRTFERLGLQEVDASALAAVANRPIELRFVADEARRGIEVWATLFSADFDFAQSRAFPLFLAAAVRWLADAPELHSDLAAGTWMPATAAPLRAQDGTLLDGVGAPFRLPRAGEWSDARGRTVTAALLDPALHDASAAASFREDAGALARATDPLPWIVLLALGLLVAEWIWFRRGRIP
jgi:hypothetical protein